MQMTFLKKIVKIIILRVEQSRADHRYKYQKDDEFSLSQKIGFVCS